jgi:regulatory protein
VHLLSLREHSRLELERKLLRRFEKHLIEEVLQELVQQDLQSDERFTEQYIYSRRNKGYGPLRIRSELSERGIDDGLIGIYLDIEAHDWKDLMLAVAARKFGEQPAADKKELAKRGRFLSARGFPSWQISDYLFH